MGNHLTLSKHFRKTVPWSRTDGIFYWQLQPVGRQELADAALVTMVPLSLLQFAMQIVTAGRVEICGNGGCGGRKQMVGSGIALGDRFVFSTFRC